jgi:hypothetical protein
MIGSEVLLRQTDSALRHWKKSMQIHGLKVNRVQQQGERFVRLEGVFTKARFRLIQQALRRLLSLDPALVFIQLLGAKQAGVKRSLVGNLLRRRGEMLTGIA